HAKKQVGRRPAAHPGLALCGEPDLLPVGDAGGNLDVQLLHLALRPAFAVALQALERQRSAGAAIGLLERDLDLRARVEAAAAEAAAGSAARAAAHAAKAAEAAEQGFEEVAVHAAAAGLGSEIELPVGRRAKLFALFPAAAELVVGRALLRVAQHFVRFVDLLEARFGVRLLAHVRMVFAGEA